jgi:acid phosphatase family membrane protein YuiD
LKLDHADSQAPFGIKIPTDFQILHQGGVDLLEETGGMPASVVQVTDLGGAVARGDGTPREAMTLFPKDAIEDAALVE